MGCRSAIIRESGTCRGVQKCVNEGNGVRMVFDGSSMCMIGDDVRADGKEMTHTERGISCMESEGALFKFGRLVRVVGLVHSCEAFRKTSTEGEEMIHSKTDVEGGIHDLVTRGHGFPPNPSIGRTAMVTKL